MMKILFPKQKAERQRQQKILERKREEKVQMDIEHKIERAKRWLGPDYLLYRPLTMQELSKRTLPGIARVQ